MSIITTKKLTILLTSIGLGLASTCLMATTHHKQSKTRTSSSHTKTKTRKASSHAAKTSSHTQFISQIVGETNVINASILKDRAKLISLDKNYQKTHTIHNGDSAWLNQLAREYKNPSTNFSARGTWTELEKRVDIIPPSLVLAQGIQESGWGRSYLAQDANNYFGQECGSSRTCYHSTNYRHFSSVNDAIGSYIHNLDTNNAYRSMRNTRAQERVSNKKINSLALADGLTSYSVLHGQYISSIKKLIVNFDLQQYDTQFV